MTSVTEDKPRGRWPKVWLLWGVLVVGSFFAIEIPALVNDDGGDTLTEQLQYVGGTAGPWWFVTALLLAVSWLLLHFVGPDSRIWLWAKEKRHGAAEAVSEDEGDDTDA